MARRHRKSFVRAMNAVRADSRTTETSMPRTPHDPLDDEGRADLAVRIAAARLLAGDTLGALRVLDMGLPVEQPTEAVA